MCGLVGILHFGRWPDAKTRTNAMANAIRHRGPDGEGFHSDADISLGFRRLAIVDIETGTQPMTNEDGRIWVVFNGEIYNHRELRRELEVAGHRFTTHHSDTEVLVHGWEQWGERLPERLNGMFAFAVWDSARRELALCRDRYGIKPLYIAEKAGRAIVFGSEVRAVHASGLIDKTVSPAGVLEYFTLMNNWHGRTPYSDVRMVLPGTLEMFRESHHAATTYWRPDYTRSRVRALPDLRAEFQSVLSSAIQRQMAADVPVMTYLSGGIDSSAVTAGAQKIDRTVRAYSCIFDLDGVGDDKLVDEREFSRAVASHLNIDRVEMVVPSSALRQSIGATVDALEYPRMGMAYVNHMIAGRVARDAKVVLSGMGGDEVTGGYVGRYAIVPRSVPPMTWRQHIGRVLGAREPATRLDLFAIYRSALNVPVPTQLLTSAFTPEFLAAARDFDVDEAIFSTLSNAPSRDPWDVVMHVDMTTYLHGLLVLEDKLSMAHSLETRVPLLDNEIVDYLLDVPWKNLCDGNMGKILFRESVRNWVPDEIYAKPKMGFGPPDASWYRGPLKGWISEQLSESRIARRGVFQPAFVSRVLDDHFTSKANHVAMIWCLLSFETWCTQTGFFGGN